MVWCATATKQGCGFAWRVFRLVKRCWVALFVFALALAAGFVLDPTTVRFALTGVDWDRVPNGYRGVLPEKVYMDLQIPREYVDTTVVPFLFWSSIAHNIGLYGPSRKHTSSIYINAYYPSMKAAPNRPSDERIGVILNATERERTASSTRMLHDGVVREPNLDHDGLCGYVDNVHAVWKDYEYYVPCQPSDRDFFIDCWLPPGARQVCTQYLFLGQRINAQVSYQHRMLKEHRGIVDAVTKLVTSFVRPITDD